MDEQRPAPGLAISRPTSRPVDPDQQPVPGRRRRRARRDHRRDPAEKNTQAQAADLGIQRAQLEHAIAVLIGPAAVRADPGRRRALTRRRAGGPGRPALDLSGAAARHRRRRALRSPGRQRPDRRPDRGLVPQPHPGEGSYGYNSTELPQPVQRPPRTCGPTGRPWPSSSWTSKSPQRPHPPGPRPVYEQRASPPIARRC